MVRYIGNFFSFSFLLLVLTACCSSQPGSSGSEEEASAVAGGTIVYQCPVTSEGGTMVKLGSGKAIPFPAVSPENCSISLDTDWGMSFEKGEWKLFRTMTSYATTGEPGFPVQSIEQFDNRTIITSACGHELSYHPKSLEIMGSHMDFSKERECLR